MLLAHTVCRLSHKHSLMQHAAHATSHAALANVRTKTSLDVSGQDCCSGVAKRLHWQGDKCSAAVPGNVGHEVGAQAVLEQGLLHHYLLKAQRRCVEERGEHGVQDGTVVNVKDGEDFSFDTCDGNA